MLNAIKDWLSGKAEEPTASHQPVTPYVDRFNQTSRPHGNNLITTAYVESLIDAVGRDRVFDRARKLGWEGANPPLWVWHQICLELLPTAPNRGNQPLQ